MVRGECHEMNVVAIMGGHWIVPNDRCHELIHTWCCAFQKSNGQMPRSVDPNGQKP